MAESENNQRLKNLTTPLVKKRRRSLDIYRQSYGKWRLLKLKLNKFYFKQVKPKTAPIYDELHTESKFEGAKKAVGAQKSKKKRLLSFLFFAINLAIVAGIIIYQFSTDDVTLGDLFSTSINWWWFVAAVALFFVTMGIDSLRLFILIKHSTKRTRAYLSYKTTALGLFYDRITPMFTGGQPFQMYYMNKRGISAGTASGLPIAKFIFHQVVFALICIGVLIAQASFIISLNPFVMAACYTGLAAMVLLTVGVLLLSVSKRVGPALTKGIVKLLHKMRIVKRYERTYAKVMTAVKEYNVTFRFFFSNFKILAPNLLLSLGLIIGFYSFPFMIYCMFFPFDLSLWFTLLTIAIVCDLSASLMPLPGGSGAAEVSFTVLAAAYFPGPGLIVLAMLLWRFFTYYGYVFQGIAIIFYDYIIGNRKIPILLNRFAAEDEAKRQAEEQEKLRQEEHEKLLNNDIIKLPRKK
ncbi:MAG: flippase-like domain-containing protein [Firmicutes bacterium]|nr:flippase-like domain-containing protein [Bacillota bacterium]